MSWIEVGDTMSISAQSEKALMYSKLLLADVSYNATVTQIFTQQLWIWNTYTGDNLSFVSSVPTVVTKEYNEWDSYYDILDDLSKLLSCQWTVKNRVIHFEPSIWQVRDFTAFYNPIEPYLTNIRDVKLQSYATQTSVVIGKSNNARFQKSDFTYLSEPVGIFESIREGNEEVQTQKILDERKIPQRILKIELQSWFDFLQVWDTIKLIIENLDEYRNFNWDAIVNTINIEYSNGTKIFTAWVSDTIVKRDEFLEKLRDISKKQRLNLL